MNRWIYVPVIVTQVSVAQVSVAQVSAQQAVSVPSEAEKALRDRVQQFYQLQMDKKYRQAEAFVAEDTKDLYFSTGKGEITGFTIEKIELLDGETKARVTIRTKSFMSMPGMARLPMQVPSVTLWKIENGQWVWYVDPHGVVETPFGKMQSAGNLPPGPIANLGAFGKMPDIDALKRQVTIDRSNVVLTADRPTATATITNSMPGFIDISKVSALPQGLSVEIGKPHLASGEHCSIVIRQLGSEPVDGTVHISVMPLGLEFEIRVGSK